MKKIKIILCAVLSVIACLCFFACGESGENADKTKDNGTSTDTTKYTVTYNGTSIEPEKYEEGYSLSAPVDPVKDNYIFLGWYSD